MHLSRTPRRLTTVLTGSVAAALLLLGSAPTVAADEQVTIDVLKVVDGGYVVETVTAPARSAAATEDSLEARPEVVDASPAVEYRPDAGDPYWDLDDPQVTSSVQDVWPRTRGAGQTVAVLDTSVDTTHPDLAGAFVPGTDTTGMPADTEWHGTGVAGVIAARADNGIGSAGMAPEARIMPIRVCAPSCSSAAVSRGILWAADHGADVINMSLSGAGYSDVTATAIRYALDKGIAVVASSGNDGLNGNPVSWPAANNGVIAVAATTPTGAPADWAVHGWQVDVSTVGEGVLVPVPEASYANGTGTSFSGPAVAGAVALLRAGHPGIAPRDVQAALQAGVDSSGPWDRAWGAGRLDVPAAMAAADRAGVAVTVTPSSQQLAVSWSPVPGATSYTVRVDGVERAVVAGTSATVGGLVDGTQVAVDVQPGNGERSRPVLADVGGALPGTPVLHSGSISGSTLSLSASVPGVAAATPVQYQLLRDGLSMGSIPFSLSDTPRTVAVNVGVAPAHESRWQLRPVDGYSRFGAASNSVVVGSGRPAPPAAAPAGLTAVQSDREVLLTWDDAGAAHTYRVSVAGSVVAAPQTAGAVLEAPAAGVARTYEVAVVDAWGQAGPAAGVTVTGTGSTATRPGAPTGVTAAPGDGQVTLSWTAAPSHGSPVTGYTVATTPGGATVSTPGSTTATVTGLTNGTSYDFTVTATNAVGTGPASQPATAVPQPAAAAPGAPGTVTAVRGDGQATVTWAAATANGSAVTGYTVTASPGGATATTTGARSVVVPGLTNGTAHTFTVRASNAVGTGPASAASNPVTPAGRPGAPGSVTAVPGNRSATVTWTPGAANGSAVTGYTVTASPGGATAATTGATSATVAGLSNGTAYTFTVRAQNAVGTGAASAPSAGVVPGASAADAIAAAYQATGGATGPLGARIGTGYPTPNSGLTQAYANGRIHWSPTTGAHAVYGDISRAYDPLTGESGVLGYPVSDRYATPGNGWTQAFEHGRIHTSPGTGAHAVYGDISRAYDPLMGESGILGYPVSGRYATPGNGWTQAFQNGRIHTSPGTGAHAVLAPISGAYDALWGESGVLGYPVSGRYATPGNGWTQAFERGRIHTSPTTGAHAVYGDISRAYDPLTGESGILGYPVSGRYATPGNGWTQAFQNGRIHTSPGTGAHAVLAPISGAYDVLRGESGVLGYPVGSRYATPGNGWTQAFQNGRIHTSPTTGAHAVYGDISRAYDPLTGESGILGYPVSDRYATPGNGWTQAFQNGRIHTSPGTGAHAVLAPISGAYDALWGESGVLGYPVGSRYATPGNGWTQAFERGRIHTSPGTGAHAVLAPVSAAYDSVMGESGPLGYPTGPARAVPGGVEQSFQRGRIAVVGGRTQVQYV
ncbi:fibronectin type III domain-containing protein [Geodermatophilus sp. CPCC 206100]|uniref:fibronectin type III domain-containing protein n=1 Tax=Geodermatophilus sp. CPCC 206100 TaxID=3020054 RepID=UPI003AFFE7F1